MTVTDPRLEDHHVAPAALTEQVQPASIHMWVKNRRGPFARLAYRLGMWARYASMPVIPGLHHALYTLHISAAALISTTLRIIWYTPLFQTRLHSKVHDIHLYGGLPYVVGPVRIVMGEGCRVAGSIIVTGRAASDCAPVFQVGNNVDLGWNSNFAVGRRIEIGNNVRLAAGTYLLGYPGHPVDAQDRASGALDTTDQIGNIVLEDDVWLGSRCTVTAGVRIGHGTIVATGSVVTKDLPPNVLAAGIPAKVVKQLPAGREQP